MSNRDNRPRCFVWSKRQQFTNEETQTSALFSVSSSRVDHKLVSTNERTNLDRASASNTQINSDSCARYFVSSKRQQFTNEEGQTSLLICDEQAPAIQKIAETNERTNLDRASASNTEISEHKRARYFLTQARGSIRKQRAQTTALKCDLLALGLQKIAETNDRVKCDRASASNSENSDDNCPRYFVSSKRLEVMN